MLIARTKCMKDPYVGALRYKFFLISWKKMVVGTFKNHWMETMKEAYQNLHKVGKDGIRDNTYYRTALSHNMRPPSSAQCHPKRLERRLGHFFTKKPARLALGEFQQFMMEARNGMFCLTLGRPNALSTSMVDSFGTFVEEWGGQRSCNFW